MNDNQESLRDRVRRLAPHLPGALQTVAQYVSQHPDITATSSAVEIGEATGTSDATVVRTARALGFSGIKDMRRSATDLLAARIDPGAVLAHRINQMHETTPLRRVLSDTVLSLGEFVEQVTDEQWAAVVNMVASARGVLCYGIPPVGHVAEYLSLMLNRIGTTSRAETATGPALADRLLNLEGTDLVIVFAPVRPFREVGAVVARAAEIGAATILITEAIGMPVSADVDQVLVTPVTSLNTAGELSIPLFLAHALMLAVAADDRSDSVHAMAEVKRIRANIIG